MKDERERVIFRREYDPYMEMWKYLCIFPDDPANPGMVSCLSMYKEVHYGTNKWIYEPLSEANIFYIYKQKIVHKNDPIIPELVQVLKDIYGGEYRVMEKVVRK